jgi:phage shock protein C
MLAGVAGGLAEHFELDPSIVRVLWAVLIVVSGGIFLLIYIVMAIVVPEEPAGSGSAGWTSAGGWSNSGGWSSSWPSSTAGPAAAGDSVAGAAAGGPAGTTGAPTPPPASATSGPADPATAPGFAAPVGGSWGPASPGPSDRSPRDERQAAREARRAARQARRAYHADRPGTGGLIAGLFLVLLGLFFLARTLVPQLDIDRYWPAGLVLLGLVLVSFSFRRTPGGDGP